MKRIATHSFAVLLAPGLAWAADHAVHPVPQRITEIQRVDAASAGAHATQYVIAVQLLKDGVLVHQSQIAALAGVRMPFSRTKETPYIIGISRNSASPDKPDITHEMLKTGFAYSVTCNPAGTPAEITCEVEGSIAENTNPQATSQETQEQLEKSIKQGIDVVALPSVEQHQWEQTMLVQDGKETVMTMGAYALKLTVHAKA